MLDTTKLTMVGTGSAFSKKFYNNSALVTFTNGYKLLIDCGHSVPKGLHDLGFPLESLDGILITHTHADHIGGLEEVALYNKFVLGGRKIDLLVPEPLVEPLWNDSLNGGLRYDDSRELELDDYFTVRSLKTSDCGAARTQIDENIAFTLYTTLHVSHMKSYAVGLIDRGEEKVFYSSDTVFDEYLLDYALTMFPWVFHDCQLFTGGVHASLDELLGYTRYIPEKQQNKIFLMHYGDNVEEFIGKTGRMRFAEQGREIIL
ncbi:ribonuclease BN [Bacillus phage vB_BsuM-Goe24]|uniref:Anti-Pycsar protein Apyc1 n=1 Tax=Bacillus phage vB_BveM-Goe7 TaxID=2593639 RepID=ACPY1_BPGO7|nr:RecName: Full=Anti-Pycsar protein Apyc1; Short=Apyc1 [Bacillus phage vB_BveM-Goe7]QDP43146.1 putative ribonuclease Z [Bacillus phage vB_BveM-Goe7]WCS69496.1 ribonuclease BN [Bacillus phage vB_BsuM-Goe24]